MEQKKVKNLYKALQRDDESVFYASEKINNTLIKKAKRSNYSKDKVFLNLYKQLENSVNIKESSDELLILPTYLPFVEQKKVLTDQHYILLIHPLTFYMQILPICVFWQNLQSIQIIVFCLLIFLRRKFIPIL